MRKLISTFGGIALSAVMLTSAAYAAEAPSFEDVKDGDWFKSSVEYVCEKGMMKGVSDTSFAPNDVTTRGMVVTILHRLEGEPAAQAASFTDVDQNQWYAAAVNWAAESGIVTGTSETTFAPTADITREQIATILYRYAGQKGVDTTASGDLSAFADNESVGGYAVDAMKWAVGQGLINGTSDNNLSPKGSATRAQAAAILMRLDQKINPAQPAGDSVTVTFHPNYGTAADITQSVVSGTAAIQPSTPVRDGYTFDGWYTAATGGDKYDFNQSVTGALELYAHWTQNDAAPVGGGGGGVGGGGTTTPVAPTKTHTQAEIDEENLMVSYMQEMVSGYNEKASKITDGKAKTCISKLVATMQDAINAHNRGEFIDREYIDEHYAAEVKEVKTLYRSLTKDERTDFISIGSGLALYTHITALMSYFGVSSSSL